MTSSFSTSFSDRDIAISAVVITLIVATSAYVLYRSGSGGSNSNQDEKDSSSKSGGGKIPPPQIKDQPSPALAPLEDPIVNPKSSTPVSSQKISSTKVDSSSLSALSSSIQRQTSKPIVSSGKRSSSDSKTNSSNDIHENNNLGKKDKQSSKTSIVRKSDPAINRQESPVAKTPSASDISDKNGRMDKTPSKSGSKKSLQDIGKIGNKTNSSRPSSAKQSSANLATPKESPIKKEEDKKPSRIPDVPKLAKQQKGHDQHSNKSSKSDLSKETILKSPTKIVEKNDIISPAFVSQSLKEQDSKVSELVVTNMPAPTIAGKILPSPESPELSPTHRIVTLPERRLSLSREELQKISPSCEFYPDFIDRDSLTTIFGRFDENESQDTVWKNDKNGKRVLVAATPLRYLEQVIEENDARSMNIFLAYYHDLFSPEELLELLIYRYLKLGKERKPYHKNVLNMFKIWDLPKGRDKYIEPSLDIENIIINNIQSFGAISDFQNGRWKFVTSDGSKSTSQAEETISGLEKIGIKEMCETWTLNEFDLFSRVSFIRPEGLGLVTNEKKNGGIGLQSRRGSRALTESMSNTIRLEEGNKNLEKKIETFNRMSKFFSISILKKKSVKDRAAIIKKLIQICEQLRYLQNFDGMMCILSCLQSVPIYRLKKTWAAVPDAFMKIFEEYSRLLSPVSGYREYRNALHQNVDRPALPYIDLTFIQDGNSEFYQPISSTSIGGSQPLLNLEKRRLFSKVFKEIYRFQCRPYATLKSDEKTQFWLSNCLIVALGYTRDEYLMKLSIEREPKTAV